MNVHAGGRQTICWRDFLVLALTGLAGGIEGTVTFLADIGLVDVLRTALLIRGIVRSTLGSAMRASSIIMMEILLAD
jgi:hypothetical protein